MPNPSPIPAGLTLVVHTDQTPDIYLRTLLENEARSGQSNAGIPMPQKRTVVSFHTGSPRLYKEARALSEMYESTQDAESLDFRHISDRTGFDWTRDEGFQHFQEILNENDEPAWITLAQSIDGDLPPHTREGLRRIHDAAKSQKMHALLIMSFPKSAHWVALQNLCSEFVEVHACEPDPKRLFAFSIKCIGLRHLHPLGVGHAMAQIQVSKDGSYSERFERFISHSVVDRLMLYLRCDGYSLKKIGDVVGLNKSSVQRRLNRLPSHWQPKLEPNWRTAYSKTFDFSYLHDDDSDDEDED